MNDFERNESALYAALVGRLRAAGSVFAEEEARLLLEASASAEELARLAERRIAGMPLEHVVGWAEFCGMRVSVDPGVFVPRPRTGLLVREAVRLARPGDIAVDLCCGSGALGAALSARVEGIELHAVDIDAAAVRCARRNLPLGFVYEGDLYAPLPARLEGSVKLLMANAPYVPTGAIRLLPQEARLHEARVALDGGEDGLDLQRKIVAQAAPWLAPNGRLLVETSERQAPVTAAIFAQYGFAAQLVRCEELDATVILGSRASL